MRVGVPKEIKDNEFRVGLIPSVVRELTEHGHSVLVESRAGLGAGFSDDDYRASGAGVVADAAEVFASAELVVKVKEPRIRTSTFAAGPDDFHLFAPRT
jgi:alanine dehydrogenase